MRAQRAWAPVQQPVIKRVHPFYGRFLVFLIIVAILAWSIYPLKQRFQQRAEMRRIRQNLITLRKENRALENEIKRLNSPDYIELLARKNFGLVKPGEEAYIVTSSQEEEAKISQPDAKQPAKKSLWQKVKKFFHGLF